MDALMLCDWTTIKGVTASGTTINQGEDQWLDVSPYLDLVFWVDCREVSSASGGVTLNLQTAPTKDEAYFKTMITATNLTALVAAEGPAAYTALASSAAVPVAAWLRWQLSCSATSWDVTFRIWVSANAPGG
jgi:hypothetical protein